MDISTALIVITGVLSTISHLAALFGFGFLDRNLPAISKLLQFLAGNYGYARNYADLIRVYEEKGGEAALAALAERLPTRS